MTAWEKILKLSNEVREYRAWLRALAESGWSMSHCKSNWYVYQQDEIIGIGDTQEAALRMALAAKEKAEKELLCATCGHLHEEGERCAAPINWNGVGEVTGLCSCESGNPKFKRV